MKIQSSEPEKKDLAYYISQLKSLFRRWGENIRGSLEMLRREKSFKAVFSVNAAGKTSAEPGQIRRRGLYALGALVILVFLILLISSLHSCASKKSTRNTAADAAATAAVQTTIETLPPDQLRAAYPQNLVVIGDSIASGYHLYGYIPEEHGLATGNAAIRSLHDYTFAYQGKENMDVTDIIADMQPAYILMSMGMNDINMISSAEYTATYQKEIEGLLEVSPYSNIIVSSITPIEYGNTFSSVDKQIEYNDALKQMIQSLGQANVVYFDAFHLLADPSTLGLKEEYSAGDGIHLGTGAYEAMLNALYPLMDTMPYPVGLVTESQTEAITETAADSAGTAAASETAQ